MTDFRSVTNRYIAAFLRILLTILVARCIEALFFWQNNGHLLSHICNNALGLCFDWFYASVAAIALYWPISKIMAANKMWVSVISKTLVATLAFLSLCLINFASQAGFPLDRAIFIYSWDEIMETIRTTNNANWWQYIAIICGSLSYPAICKIRINTSRLSYYIAITIVISSSIVRFTAYDNSARNTAFAEQCNKIGYLISSVAEGITSNSYSVNDIDIYAKQFHEFFPDHKFEGAKSPLLHDATTNNVLGPFLQLTDRKPNIVIIICEGLARENSGNNSRYTSATPYLDSLSANSLCWDNCLSVSQRTFGVLPALFGALPFGLGGFMEMGKNAPNFHSLPKILKDNGYIFRFFYGGWCAFDNTNAFVELNGVSNNCFSEGISDSVPRNEWGLLDKELFKEAVKSIDFGKNTPRLDVYLTLTSHGPWDYPDKDSYIDQYRKLCQAKHTQPNPDETAAASYLYVDEALRQLIASYRNKPGFDNTIFVITGDHNYNAWTKIINRYHVPFIIWSPMLTTARTFPALVSHREFTPTMLSLLKQQYNINTPNKVAWINREIDTASYFRSKTFIPQSDPSRNIVSMVYNDQFVYNDKCNTITFDGQTLDIETNNNKELTKLFSNYKNIDRFVCANNALIEQSQLANMKRIFKKKGYSISTSDEFKNLIDIPFPDKHHQTSINLSFRIKQMSDNDGVINMVFEVRDTANNCISYQSNVIQKEHNKWKVFAIDINMQFPDSVYSNGNKLIGYIWNPKQMEYKLSRINIDIRQAENE